MFRMVAADELLQELVAFVFELLVDADVGGVVAEDCARLRLAEELLERRRRRELVFGRLCEQRRLLLGGRPREGHAELRGARLVKRGESVRPRLLRFVERLA